MPMPNAIQSVLAKTNVPVVVMGRRDYTTNRVGAPEGCIVVTCSSADPRNVTVGRGRTSNTGSRQGRDQFASEFTAASTLQSKAGVTCFSVSGVRGLSRHDSGIEPRCRSLMQTSDPGQFKRDIHSLVSLIRDEPVPCLETAVADLLDAEIAKWAPDGSMLTVTGVETRPIATYDRVTLRVTVAGSPSWTAWMPADDIRTRRENVYSKIRAALDGAVARIEWIYGIAPGSRTATIVFVAGTTPMAASVAEVILRNKSVIDTCQLIVDKNVPIGPPIQFGSFPSAFEAVVRFARPLGIRIVRGTTVMFPRSVFRDHRVADTANTLFREMTLGQLAGPRGGLWEVMKNSREFDPVEPVAPTFGPSAMPTTALAASKTEAGAVASKIMAAVNVTGDTRAVVSAVDRLASGRATPMPNSPCVGGPFDYDSYTPGGKRDAGKESCMRCPYQWGDARVGGGCAPELKVDNPAKIWVRNAAAAAYILPDDSDMAIVIAQSQPPCFPADASGNKLRWKMANVMYDFYVGMKACNPEIIAGVLLGAAGRKRKRVAADL